LVDALSERGVSTADALKVLGDEYGLPSRILSDPPVEQGALAYIPEESARHYKFAPLKISDGALEVGIVDPDNIEALDALQFISTKVGLPYKLFIISDADFARVLEAYKNLTGEVGKALTEYETVAKAAIDTKEQKAQPAALTEEGTLDLSGTSSDKLKEDAPVTKIVSTILRYAIEGKASDIHIEPTPEKTRVRFRMDGELHTS